MESNRVTLITGGTKGIGFAVAQLLAETPGTVVLAHRTDEQAAARAARELGDRVASIVVRRCDVGDARDTADLFRLVNEIGELTTLVNCAGYAEAQAAFEDITAERWARILTANVIGTANCCREAVVRMKNTHQDNRAIVNLSSRAAELGSPGEYVDYAASEAAVDTLTRGLALEVAPYGIHVNSVRPGIIDTGFHATAGDPGRSSRVAANQPMRRVGKPREVAKLSRGWCRTRRATPRARSSMSVAGADSSLWLNAIADHINERPRKVLDWASSHDAYADSLTSISGAFTG